MQSLDYIRPFHDHEVHDALQKGAQHPMIKALLGFALPEKSPEEIQDILNDCHSIRDFQINIIYPAVLRLLEKSSEGLTSSGFDKLISDQPYLFISNHRDIVLDTSLLNTVLYEHNLLMTASAIGDNLVHKPFLMLLSRLNRNFLVQRGLPPKEMLESSKMLSEYIHQLLTENRRSVWIAQREGRTKDGDDCTQQGVLKMITLARNSESPATHLKRLKLVPVAISYEMDPTDRLKMPELLAKHFDEPYVKTANEDFNSILQGALGQKKRIHIAAGAPMDTELEAIDQNEALPNKQLTAIAEVLDRAIHSLYKLWPSHYIAFDLYYQTEKFKDFYDEKEKRQFERRLEKRIDINNEVMKNNFLLMYANPVINYLNLNK